MKLNNNKILITGGASGIGLGLTERFVRENNTVIVCGRRKEILREVSERLSSVITWECDLSIEKERIDLYNWISENHSDLNVLVNNAGIQNRMNIYEDDFFEKSKQEIEINILAPIQLTKLFINLKSLRTILNVTSGLAFVPLTSVPVYCASKAFFHSFTLSIRHTLKSRNIEVIEIIPPALNTDLGGKGLHDEYPPVSEFIEAVFSQLKNGSIEISHGFSEITSKATPEVINSMFNRMNQ